MKKVSVKKAIIHAAAAEKKVLRGWQKDGTGPVATADSFVNFQQKMGLGADYPLAGSSYGFNPITRIRTLLEWAHRGSWIAGMVIDIIAKDMTRAGVEVKGKLQPDKIEKIQEGATRLKIWNSVQETIQWAKLYGGSIAVMLIDGQDLSTPLRIETVGKGQFKGLSVFDRWMCNPTLNDLVTEMGPDIGLPKFYDINLDTPALRGKRVHYSRCLRMIGIKLPHYQRLMENLWGESVLERLYDRMIAFDSATTGAAQLVYKAYLRTIKVEGLRDIIAAGGDQLDGLVKYLEMQRRFQNLEGLLALDSKDDFVAHANATFSGLSDALIQFGQQLAGASGIPLVRLFGQSPAGLNSTGDADLRMYYDNINQQQQDDLLVALTTIYRVLAQSEGTPLPEGSTLKFRPLWQLSEKEKSEIAQTTTTAVAEAEEKGLITQKGAMKELRQSSEITGIFTNITDAEIEQAAEDLPPAGAEAVELEQQAQQQQAEAKEIDPGAEVGKVKDVAGKWTGEYSAVIKGKRVALSGTVEAPDAYVAGDRLRELFEKKYGKGFTSPWVKFGKKLLPAGSLSQKVAKRAGPGESEDRLPFSPASSTVR